MLDPKYIPLFVGGFIAWICFMIFVGWITSRGKSEGSSFLTGGGNLGFFLIFCTVGATMIGTGSSMGAIGNGYNHGWGGAIYGLGASAGILSMLLFTKAKNKGFLTMSEEAQYYYGGKKIIRQVMGFMMFVIEIIWLGNHLNGGAKYLAYVTQMPDVTCKIITVLGFGIYVFIGGYMAVVTTDAVQFIAILIGFLTIAFRAIPMAGGYQNVVDTFTAVGKPGAMTFYGLGSYGVMAAIALVLSTAMGVIGTPTHRTRIYTSKDEKTARKAFLGQGILLFGWSFVTAIIGMSCFTIATMNGDTLASGDYAFAYMATNALPPVVGMLFMICGLSATMSSGDSDAISGVTILLTDVYPQHHRQDHQGRRLRQGQPCRSDLHPGRCLLHHPVRQRRYRIHLHHRGRLPARRGCGYAAGPLLEACQLAGRSGLHRLRYFAGRADPGAAFLQELDQRHHGWSGCACYHRFSGVRHRGLSHVLC